MEPKPSVRFDDIEYRVNHGGVPRGRGSWAFAAVRDAMADEPSMFWSQGGMTYGDAKRAAKAHFQAWAAERGMSCVVVWVQP